MTLATEVEQARIVEPATAVKTTARSGRNSALVGALIGLLLSCAAALLADPFLARRARLDSKLRSRVSEALLAPGPGRASARPRSVSKAP